MPTASLAASIGGEPARAEPLLPSETTMEEAKPDSMRPLDDAAAEGGQAAVGQAAVGGQATPADTDSHADDKTERAPLQPLFAPPAQPSGWTSFVAWFKGMFGGN